MAASTAVSMAEGAPSLVPRMSRKGSLLDGSVDGSQPQHQHHQQQQAAPPPNPDDAGRAPCPLDNCPWWRALSFAWLNPIIALGKRRVLEEADLPALSKAERAERLQDLVLVRG